MGISFRKQPTAVAPIAMSLAALFLVLRHAAVVGVGREADEGIEAHLFQLLMAGQVPFIAYFALKWLPQLPGQALRVLALQAAAAFAAFASLYWLEHA